MKKLKINLDDLMSSFTFNSDGLSKEYLSLESGEIIHIPNEVARVVEDEKDPNILPQWELDLVPEAELVLIEEPDNYIEIPVIESSYFYNVMQEFAENEVKDENISDKLIRALNGSRPMGRFKDVLHNYEAELEQWYAYEDQKTKEYVLEWLSDNEIEVD